MGLLSNSSILRGHVALGRKPLGASAIHKAWGLRERSSSGPERGYWVWDLQGRDFSRLCGPVSKEVNASSSSKGECYYLLFPPSASSASSERWKFWGTPDNPLCFHAPLLSSFRFPASAKQLHPTLSFSNIDYVQGLSARLTVL
jgi:hypothetical protein